MGIRELSPELAKKARIELGEDPDRVLQDIQHIKDWAAKQPHLRARLDDQWLIAFLRESKFSLERAKEKIDTFYTLRTTFPELMTQKDPMNPITQKILKLGLALPLPSHGLLEPRVILVRPGCYDPSKFKIVDTIKIITISADLSLMEDDTTIVNGQIYIVDLANVGIRHMAQWSPALMKKVSVLTQEALPVRQKGTHYINIPPGFETLLNTAKTFLSEKSRSRLFLHSQDMESLYKHIPKSVLPKEYGGDAGPIQDLIVALKKRLEDHREWYLDDKKYGTDESKRMGAPKTSESMFGLEGSFRQLKID